MNVVKQKRQQKERDNSFLTYKLALALCLILFMFQVTYAASEPVYKQPRPEKELEADEKPEQKKEEKKTKKKERYVYNPAGKTDPFVSFISKSGAEGTGAKSLTGRDLDLPDAEAILSNKEPKSELEKIDISKLTLTAVVKGESKVWAMVVDPKGIGYFLEKGTKIGLHSGVVDEIICDEKKTAFGLETIKKVIIKVPYRDRNRDIIYRSIEMEMPYKAL